MFGDLTWAFATLHRAQRKLDPLAPLFPTGNVAVLGVHSIFKKLSADNSFLFVHGINPVISYVIM